MKKWINRTGIALVCVWIFTLSAGAVRMLIPGGQAVGLELRDNTVTVASFDGAAGTAAEQAGLQVGDRIVSVDGQTVRTAEDVRKALDCSDGTVEVKVQRNQKTEVLRLSPVITENGPKLGIYLKQGVTGVGTVTWYDPDSGRFATLGHGVNNARGELLNMVSGTAYRADGHTERGDTCWLAI